jgi:hypothetical protein
MRSQPSAVSRQLEDDGSVAIRGEPRHIAHELVRQLALRPAPSGNDVAHAAEMPRQLDQVRVRRLEVGDVHEVRGA